MGASAIWIGPHTTASSPPRERRGSRLRGRSNLLPTAGVWRRLVRLRTARSSSWPHGERTARSRSGRARRVPSSRSSGRRPGRPSSPAGRGVAPGLVGQAIVQRFRRARFLGREDAVDVPLVQRPVEDPPVPAIQKGNRLPERLEEAGVVEAVEQFPVLRLDRVVDDLGPESEVAHDRADRKSTRLNSSHVKISYAVFCLKKKKKNKKNTRETSSLIITCDQNST